MTPATYRALARHAGAWLRSPDMVPRALGLEELPDDVSAVVYVAEGRHGQTLGAERTRTRRCAYAPVLEGTHR